MKKTLPWKGTRILLVCLLFIIPLVVLPATAASPVITLLGRDPTSIPVGSVGYFDAGAMASDLEDGDLTASIIVTDNVDVTVAGMYSVEYSVTDIDGNTAMASRVVNVVNRLDPVTVPKYQTPLVIPPEMPKTSTDATEDYYEIAVKEFDQQVLPAGMPMTTVWSYGSATSPGTLNYPAFTIEATWNKMTKVKWINGLVDQNGNYLPHLLPIDQTLHWANPPGGTMGRDMHGTDPNPYLGPVPAVIHVHGAHTYQESDGYPEAWYLPAANNIPSGYATTGTYYDIFKASSPVGGEWQTGSSVFQYPNDQRATTLWYHDHSLGMTRTNVYTGPAGFYLLRGGPDDLDMGFNPPSGTLGMGVNPGAITEIPIAIQDRSFNEDGSLFYPDTRAFFDGFTGPYAPDSDIAPIWNPEFFGDSMVVNGNTWPYLEVEQRQYRLRLLNGHQSRFLILKLDNGMSFTQIGTEGGFLPQPVQLTQLLIGPAERADVIVDFTNIPVGTSIILQNIGPDEPFGGGSPCPPGQDPVNNPGCGDFAAANPDTTGQVMQLRVVAATGPDPSTPVSDLVLPTMAVLGPEDNVRQISLNEVDSAVLPGVGPQAALLGTVMIDGMGMPMGMPMMWMDAITESVNIGDTEIWEIYDFTMDAHPIHIHQVQFQVVNREVFDPMVGTPGTIIPPEVWESGYKDTVIVYPGQLTRVKAKFTLPGLFVWHCHILEHEDNEMMRPYEVLSGALRVCKEDLAGNPLKGWEFTANGLKQTTDATGCTIFESLAPGAYTVTETLQTGWTNVTPLSQDALVTVNALTDLLFVNDPLVTPGVGTLKACKEDTKGTPLSGWDFTADGLTQTTGTDGCTVFTLVPGIYTVTETLQTGWTNVTPLAQAAEVTEGYQSSLLFVNDPMVAPGVGTLKVCKENPEGTPLSGWTFIADGLTQTTDKDGCTLFENLVPGTYTVMEELKPNWINVTSLTQDVEIQEGVQTNVTFVNMAVNGSVKVCKEDDASTRIPGWDFTLDGKVQTTSTNGCTIFDDLTPGQYTIEEELKDDWFNITPASQQVTVVAGEQTRLLFVNRQHGSIKVCKENEASTRIPGWNFTLDGKTQTTGSNGCTIFVNLTAGQYTVTEEVKDDWFNITPISQKATVMEGEQARLLFVNRQHGSLKVCKEDETGKRLSGWDFTLDEKTQTTGSNGCTIFLDLPTRKYTVTEELKPEWTNVTPLSQEADVISGEQARLLFVNRQHGSLKVCKEDTKGSRLSGWDFTLDGKTQTTDSNGCTIFLALPAGEYTVTEEMKSGWTNVSPLSQKAEVLNGEQARLLFVNTPIDEWCGKSVGFWKTNVDKYVDGKTNGRQVCDAFFTTNSPGELCAASDIDGICDCAGDGDCPSWQCINDKLAVVHPNDACEKALAQKLALFMTSQNYEDGFDFRIDTNRYPSTDCCKEVLRDACGGKTCSVEYLWNEVLPDLGCKDAQKLAECLNNYEFGCSKAPELSVCADIRNPFANPLSCFTPKPGKVQPTPTTTSSAFIKIE